DQLIVALGSVSRALPIPGLTEHARGFKTLPDAIALRNRVIGCLEAAETLDDPQARDAWLTFVFVGAGYAGLEGAAELQDFAVDVLDHYPRCRTQGVNFVLVEGADGVWAIGDAAAVPDPAQRLKRSTPPTAQHAIRQGRRAARNVAASLGRGRIQPFRYRTLGVFVDMGRGEAVAQTIGLRWRG